MPIVEIKNEDLPTASVKCHCGKVNDIPLSTLVLGAPGGAPDQIVLPPCACGAQEFLCRTFDAADRPGTGHRKAVNALAGYLKGAGRVHPAALAAIQAETVKPLLTRPLIGKV